jgi:hypothetical protein
MMAKLKKQEKEAKKERDEKNEEHMLKMSNFKRNQKMELKEASEQL